MVFTWYTPEEFVERFKSVSGNGSVTTARAEELLAISHQQCVTYAPVPVDLTVLFEAGLTDDPAVEIIPPGHREAHFQQARNIWNASKVGPNGAQGDTFALSPFPLDWHVKQLLRPETGDPVVA